MMDLLTVSSLYHSSGAPLPMRLVWLTLGLLVVIAVQWRFPSCRRAPVRVVQRLLALAGLMIALWLVAVEILVFRGHCPLCAAASVLLVLAFAGGLLRAGGKAFVATLLLAALGLGYLLPFGTISKVSVLAEAAPAMDDPDRPQLGTGPLLVQEFSDFQCGACAGMDATVERFVERHGTELRFVYRHFPLSSIHPWAEQAAVASECAARQGRFSEVRKFLFENQRHLGSLLNDEDRSSWPVPNPDLLQACLVVGQSREIVEKDMADAGRLRLRSTPSLLIGQTLVVGMTSLSRLESILDFARTKSGTTAGRKPVEIPESGCTADVATGCTSQ